MKTKTQLIKLATMVITVIFALMQGAAAMPEHGADSLRTATLATTPAHITSDDVMNMEEILMTSREMRHYFVEVFSEYSNDSIDILSAKGKRLLAAAQEIGRPINENDWLKIQKVVTWFKNIQYMTGDEIKKQLPSEYFQLPFSLESIKGQKIDIPLVLGCVNRCDFCPVNEGGVKQRMPYPLVVMLAKLKDQKMIRYTFGTFNYEPLYYADVVHKKNGEWQADILFADVLKLFRPGTGRTNFTTKQAWTDNMTWQFVTHGPLSNKKNMYHKIAQLNIERLNKAGKENDRFGMGKIAFATMEISVDTSSILWREFENEAEKMQLSPQESDQYKLEKYFRYYIDLIVAFKNKNKENKVELRIYEPPTEMTGPIAKKRRKLIGKIVRDLKLKRLFSPFDMQFTVRSPLRYENEKSELWTMQVLSQKAYDEIKSDHKACKNAWMRVLFPKGVSFSLRLSQLVVRADGQVMIRVHPKLIMVNQAGITLSEKEKEIVAEAMLYRCLYDRDLLGVYAKLLSQKRRNELGELLELINERDDFVREILNNTEIKQAGINKDILKTFNNINKKNIEPKLRQLADGLLAEDVPLPVIPSMIPKLIAEGYGPRFTYIPIVSHQKQDENDIGSVLHAA
jgi:hypothetical protein